MRKHLLVSFFFLVTSAAAQAPDLSQTELIRQLVQKVEQLEKRLSELEAGRSSSAAPALAAATTTIPATPPVSVATAAADHDHAPTGEPSTTYPALRLSGFTDINFTSSDQRGGRSGFNEGQFILHLSASLAPRVVYFGEVSGTARADAGTGSPPATGFNVEMERSIIRFEQSDHLKLSFGRYHTPISYWNTQFHHGYWLQTTAGRPEAVQFGSNFIPVHFVGALAEGSFAASGLNLNYNLGIGNGRGSVLSRAGDFGDVNNNKAWLATVFIKPDRLYGLQLGGSVYRDKINAIGRPETREWIHSAHVVWSKENPEFIAEFFNINHRQPGSALSVNSQSMYAQVAYRLPRADNWKPYYRYEYTHIPLSDSIFRGLVSNLSGSTFGARYDISSFAATKFEYRRQARPGIPNINLFWTQVSFTF